MEAYHALAASYDRLTNDVDYHATVDFYYEILEREGLQPRTAADLACGTGSVALLLAEKGLMPCAENRTDGTFTNLVCKIIDGHIVFKHPVNGRRVCLPPIYAGAILEIGNQKYRMPSINSSAAKTAPTQSAAKKVSIWE